MTQPLFTECFNLRYLINRPQTVFDDILDAYVLAWIASRIVFGQANRIPVESPTDKKGLQMEIWY